MLKNDTIDAIRNLNPTAASEFLAEFSNDDLCRYLDRLTRANARRDMDDPTNVIELDESSPVDLAVMCVPS